jgi:hypothetical protein
MHRELWAQHQQQAAGAHEEAQETTILSLSSKFYFSNFFTLLMTAYTYMAGTGTTMTWRSTTITGMAITILTTPNNYDYNIYWAIGKFVSSHFFFCY